jgi:hypothetical protein
MINHLTQIQISEAIAGQVSEPSRQHLRICDACRAEVARLQTDMALFGNAVRDWSEAVSFSSARVEISATPRALFPRFAFAALAATCVLILVVALIITDPLHRNRYQPGSGASPVEDAALLTQVDAELARTVPASMEPLTKLMAVNRSAETKQ